MGVRVAMNQPYLFPYTGYFDLIASVDKFVVYDDAKYIKGGWINRNFFPEMFTFRLKKHSDYAKINECYFLNVKEDIVKFKRKFPNLRVDRYLNKLNDYEDISTNITYTLLEICEELGITTPFYYASDYYHGKFANGVVDIVKALGGDTYVNLPGGKELYTQKMFGDIKLEFIETTPSPSILCSL